MNERIFSVIILGPRAPNALKLHLSRGVATILLSVIVLTVVIMAGIAIRVPRISDSVRAQLEAENRALRAEAVNAALDIRRLNEKVVSLEEKSKHMDDLMKPSAD
jgi:hypothetical protein